VGCSSPPLLITGRRFRAAEKKLNLKKRRYLQVFNICYHNAINIVNHNFTQIHVIFAVFLPLFTGFFQLFYHFSTTALTQLQMAKKGTEIRALQTTIIKSTHTVNHACIRDKITTKTK